VIIEMNNQVGGLSKTINYKGNLIDIGGHRFFSKSEKIINWWLQFLPLANGSANEIPLTYQNQTIELHKNATLNAGEGGKMLIRPRKSRIYFDHSFFDYPLCFNRKTLRNFGITKITRITLSYFHSKFFPIKDEQTLEQFFINRFGNELYRTFFKGYTEKIWGVTCDLIPADWGHQRIKDLNIGKAILQSFKSLFTTNKSIHQQGVSTSLIEQFLYPEKGPGQMWETVAQKVIELGGEIYLGYEVEKIMVDNNHICSVTCRELSSGNTIELTGDYFFSTIPVKNLVASLVNTVVPSPVKDLASRLSYRDFIMVGLLFKKQYDKGRDGFEVLTDNWIYLQDKDLIAGRLQIFNNWSPQMVKDKNNLWVGMEYFCSESDTVWNKSREEMIELALKEITEIGLIQKKALIDSTVIKIPKAYPSYIGAYDQFAVIQEFLDKIENLYLTGRNGMHRYNNADHSMMTAMIAVDNIINNQKDRSNIWAVNMEQDFHEESLKRKA
ncbi:MAG TPA: NAD(P)/FAD-dependent oxidoreductase, partial [Puia sp.]